MNIQERLRDACVRLRRTPMPIADVIPLLQEAAATIDVLQLDKKNLLSDYDKGISL